MDEILPWDRQAVDQAALIKKTLEAQGTPIGGNDTTIAGHAISAGCMLVTNNMGEFMRVPGLKVEDWIS